MGRSDRSESRSSTAGRDAANAFSTSQTMTMTVVPPTRGRSDHRAPVIAVRRVDAADAPALATFYAALPDADRRRRFLGTSRGPGLHSCELLCSNDHVHNEGFVAILGTTDERDGRVVGHLCLTPDDEGNAWLAPDADGQALEIGIAIAADWQRRGIGRRLFAAALDWAAEHGIGSLCATCFADNAAVLRLLSSAPESVIVPTCDPAVVQVEIRVPGGPDERPMGARGLP